MEDASQQLFEVLATPSNLLIVAGAYALTQSLTKAFPRVFHSPLAARLKPGASIVWCSICMWIPGLGPEGLSTGSKILLGIVLGNSTSHGHKILKQTIFGQDHRIKDKRVVDPELRAFIDKRRLERELEQMEAKEKVLEQEEKRHKKLIKKLEKILS